MRYLGKISYGLYVFHLLTIVIARRAVERSSIDSWWLTAGVALVLTVAISATSYAVLEKPFLRLKRRFEAVSGRPI
jgi:peptidoglycan/LPS O-acetylase OafA/YrhL